MRPVSTVFDTAREQRRRRAAQRRRLTGLWLAALLVAAGAHGVAIEIVLDRRPEPLPPPEAAVPPQPVFDVVALTEARPPIVPAGEALADSLDLSEEAPAPAPQNLAALAPADAAPPPRDPPDEVTNELLTEPLSAAFAEADVTAEARTGEVAETVQVAEAAPVAPALEAVPPPAETRAAGEVDLAEVTPPGDLPDEAEPAQPGDVPVPAVPAAPAFEVAAAAAAPSLARTELAEVAPERIDAAAVSAGQPAEQAGVTAEPRLAEAERGDLAPDILEAVAVAAGGPASEAAATAEPRLAAVNLRVAAPDREVAAASAAQPAAEAAATEAPDPVESAAAELDLAAIDAPPPAQSESVEAPVRERPAERPQLVAGVDASPAFEAFAPTPIGGPGTASLAVAVEVGEPVREAAVSEESPMTAAPGAIAPDEPTTAEPTAVNAALEAGAVAAESASRLETTSPAGEPRSEEGGEPPLELAATPAIESLAVRAAAETAVAAAEAGPAAGGVAEVGASEIRSDRPVGFWAREAAPVAVAAVAAEPEEARRARIVVEFGRRPGQSPPGADDAAEPEPVRQAALFAPPAGHALAQEPIGSGGAAVEGAAVPMPPRPNPSPPEERAEANGRYWTAAVVAQTERILRAQHAAAPALETPRDAVEPERRAEPPPTLSEEGLARVEAEYRDGVNTRLRRAAGARQLQDEGEVVVAFTITTTGSVSGVRVVRSSGVPTVDQAALAAVNRAGFMPIPTALGRSSMFFEEALRFVQ